MTGMMETTMETAQVRILWDLPLGWGVFFVVVAGGFPQGHADQQCVMLLSLISIPMVLASAP